jgi:hypothetical protein
MAVSVQKLLLAAEDGGYPLENCGTIALLIVPVLEHEHCGPRGARPGLASGLRGAGFNATCTLQTHPPKRPKTTMKGSDPSKFGDRLSDGAKARQAQLEKARAKLAEIAKSKPERDAERARIAREREAREAARKTEKEARLKREAEERVATEAARLEAERLAVEERERTAKEEKAKLAKLLVDQKAARDARYAARKARQK